VRLIDEKQNRLQNSNDSYTFHGRDVYAYTAARLASGVIKFEEVGALLQTDIIRLAYQKPVFENGVIQGNIDILDVQYGNVWTNIDHRTFSGLKVAYGDKVHVKIFENSALRYQGTMVFGKTFSDVKNGESISYMNSLLNFSMGINQDNFSVKKGVGSGPSWRIEVSK
jgi:S-adenosylmethionine hydrolase